MRVPTPRGALSERLLEVLRGVGSLPDPGFAGSSRDDEQLTLWVLYELHYRGFDDVDPAWEWDPDLLRIRASLEAPFERRLRERFTPPDLTADPLTQLRRLIEEHAGVSMARFVQRDADRDQVLELLRHRSIYHLKEADPTAWVVPRLTARAKAALLEVQFDEYGNGDPNALHHELFARGMAAVGLQNGHGAYIDEAPVEILELNNALSLFGLHRRLRGAALGHLAAFEATSSLPSRQMAQGLRRLGLAEECAAYYDEHVVADAAHEQLAISGICGGLLADEPEHATEMLFGAFTCLDLEDRYARSQWQRWKEAA